MSKTALTGLDVCSNRETTGTYEHGTVDAKNYTTNSKETSEAISRPGVVMDASLGTCEPVSISAEHFTSYYKVNNKTVSRPGKSVGATLGTYVKGAIGINSDCISTYSKVSRKSISRPGIAIEATLGYRGVTGHTKVVKCNVIKYIGYSYQPLTHEGVQAEGFQFGTVSRTPSYVNIAVAPTHHQVVLVKKVLEGVQFSVGEKITVYQPRTSPLEWSPGVWNGQGK